ncbi:hypothetical protein ACF08B_39405 [Streptomyces sp. NPDC015139]|uniref:hypothetical protein n=1 Tax=Streptomyces sp. NPDC015139 TaxID=3364942 RepID=UPI0036F4DEE3
MSRLALLHAVALGIAASTDLGAPLGLILLVVVVVVGLWLRRELHAEIVRLQATLDYRRPIDVYVADEVEGKMTITAPLPVLEQACRVARSPVSRYWEACQAGPHMVNRYVRLITYAAAVNPAEFEGFRADLTDKGRQLLNELLMLSPHQHHRSTTRTPRQTAGRPDRGTRTGDSWGDERVGLRLGDRRRHGEDVVDDASRSRADSVPGR